VYYFKKIKFEKIDVLIKLYKKQGKSKSEVLSLFTQEDNRLFVQTRFDELAEMTVNEALALQNAEQRMIALTVFNPDEFIAEVNAELLDEQTVSKKQIRWNEVLQPYEVVYEDTYSLYKISAFELGLENIARTSCIYFVKCKCTSTGKIYYLYVPESIADLGDAIGAIAWTYRFNDSPLSKEQYLNLIYTET
jgi:hypothetical protein